MSEHNRRDARVDAELRIRLAYGSLDDFIERYATNISRGGIFVRTLDPQPPGTEVALDVALDSGDQVIRGTGVVRWTTAPSAPGEPHREPGMGIRFTELSTESRALVELVVATRGAAGRSDEPPTRDEIDIDLDLDVDDMSFEAIEPGVRRSPDLARPQEPAATPSRAATPAPVAGSAPAPVRRSSLVIGIDLGTTNSCAAVVRGGRAEVIASKEGHRTLPSIVAYDAQGRLLVGHAAKAQMIVNPRNTVYGSKRLVGRRFVSPTVQACRDRFHYDIVEGQGGAAAVRFAGREFSLQQVAAVVLKEIREMASKTLGEDIARAVVTVPAYYNDHQRNAVREAGELAGLEIVRIVNEPTAAALAFGYGRGLDKRVLVYDLGGGTFDASVLEIQGDVYEVISTGGDTFLGGVDLDAQIVDHLAWKFIEIHGFPPPDDRVVWQRLRDAAEETKIALSSRESAVASVPYLCKSPAGTDASLEVTITRAELEVLTKRLVDRSIEVCLEVLSAKGLGTADLQEVLLVGGQSRMPLVWRRIREALGREPNKSVHPDEAVALGAALLADSFQRIDSVVLVDVLAMGIGVGLPGGRMVSVLPRNTKLPARKVYYLVTTKDGQTELELQVFQGDSTKVSECEYLGTLKVGNLPPRPRGGVQIEVEFSLGAEGILSVAARDKATGELAAARFATLDTPEALKAKLQVPEPQTAPKGARPVEPVPPPAAVRKGLFGKLFAALR
jgi:molecular chaperone DnaK